MKRLLFLIVLFCPPAFAEDLPILWFEAGTDNEMIVRSDDFTRWSLRHEHRIIGRETAFADHMRFSVPSINPGMLLPAIVFRNDTPYRKVFIASPDPFIDRKAWFEQHPIALYDPEGTTIEIFEDEEMPFTRLRSFADIEAVKKGIVIVGEGTDFDRERGLAELLFEYAANGGIVFVTAPKGDIQLDFSHRLRSLLMTDNPKHLFPDASKRAMMETWILYSARSEVVLRGSAMGWDRGITIVDICFDNIPPTNGRIVFDREPIFTKWKTCVESRWYFKSLIETLSCQN